MEPPEACSNKINTKLNIRSDRGDFYRREYVHIVLPLEILRVLSPKRALPPQRERSARELRRRSLHLNNDESIAMLVNPLVSISLLEIDSQKG